MNKRMQTAKFLSHFETGENMDARYKCAGTSSYLANIRASCYIFDEDIFLDAAVIRRIPLFDVNVWIQDWNPSLPLGSDSVHEVLQKIFPISNMGIKDTC